MDDDELKRLRWRCRRGMQELDTLLGRFLRESLASQPQPVKTAFGQLLDAEDDELWRWLSGQAEPADEGLRDVVRRIQQFTAD